MSCASRAGTIAVSAPRDADSVAAMTSSAQFLITNPIAARQGPTFWRISIRICNFDVEPPKFRADGILKELFDHLLKL